jgi:uncharacterized membrane protein YGL010W
MRTVNEWFANYSNDHQHPTNRAVHWICVPAILWSAIAALWVIPTPAFVGFGGAWAILAMAATWLFYLRLSRPLALFMLAVFFVFGVVTAMLQAQLGSTHLLWLAAAVFVVAWIGQFVGHIIEGKRPSFFTDLAYLLIGPAWLTGKLMRRAHIAY